MNAGIAWVSHQITELKASEICGSAEGAADGLSAVILTIASFTDAFIDADWRHQSELLMSTKIGILLLFVVLTIGAGLAWRLTASEWWGGIFGNMLVGAVTLFCVDLLLDVSTSRENRPARASAQQASLQVYGYGVRMLFDIYGATYLLGLIPEADHKRVSKTEVLEDLAPYLAATPLRATAFSSPSQPAFALLVQDAFALQNKINVVLSTQGAYIDPSTAAALYKLSQSRFVAWTISGATVDAIPERYDRETYMEFAQHLAELKKAAIGIQPIKQEMPKIGAFAMLEQPGVWGSQKAKNLQPSPNP